MTLSEATLFYTLHLADDCLILGHRNSELTGHGPILEQDIALSNIALDLIGQARNFYQYAAEQMNAGGGGDIPTGMGMRGAGREILPGARMQAAGGSRVPVAGGEMSPESRIHGAVGPRVQVAGATRQVTEDQLAYLRDGWDFRNCLLVEQGNGDWAKTILRQFFFSAYQVSLYEKLAHSRDENLAAIGAKSYKEAIYHLRWSSEWVIRLGDGTEESHTRMERALDELWKFTGELHTPVAYEERVVREGAGPDLSMLQPVWEEKVREVFNEATLSYPPPVWMQGGGKDGRHTEHLGYVLAEMQFLQRAYPDCEW